MSVKGDSSTRVGEMAVFGGGFVIVNVVVALAWFGVCSENVDPDTFRGFVCELHGAGTTALFVMTALLTLFGLSNPQRDRFRATAIALAAVNVGVFAALAVAGG